MSLEDALDPDEEVSYKQAEREIKRHGATMIDFIAVHGVSDTYRTLDVLSWLGY